MKFLVDVGVGRKVEVIKNILSNYSDRLKSSFCVYQDGKLRIRG
jgi:hypothetical protein